MKQALKSLILWDHPRGSRYYDIFCLLIIAFIFLTPKAWFDSGEKFTTPAGGSAVQSQAFKPVFGKEQ